jgi:signal transduction histidine kinase
MPTSRPPDLLAAGEGKPAGPPPEPAASGRGSGVARPRPRLAPPLALPLLAGAVLLAAALLALAADRSDGARVAEALDQAARARELHLAALQHREALRDLLAARGSRGDLDSAASRMERAEQAALGGGKAGPALPETRRAADAAARARALALEAAEALGPLPSTRARFEDAHAREVLPPIEDAARGGAERARAALASAQAAGRRRLALGACASILALLLALGPALLLARRLSRAVGQLRSAARRIGEGDFSEPVRPMAGELGELAEAMNQMAAELEATGDRERLIAAAEARIQLLEEGRAELEARVEERTRALARANADLAENLHRLSEAQRRLMISDRLAAIGQLAAAVAHEVNNPISSVTSNLSFLADEVRTLAGELRAAGTPLDAGRESEIAAAFSDAHEASLRVARIVRDLGTIARGESEPAARVDLRQAVEAAINLAHAGAKHQARIDRHLGDVPEVLASSSRLGQVFLPVLLLAGRSIALRGASAHGVIRVATWTDPGGSAVAEIADDGGGLAAEALAQLFDPFGPLQPSGPGFGLGLAVAHGIVTSLGGTIEVKSDVGVGTCVRVALPAAPPLAMPRPRAASA